MLGLEAPERAGEGGAGPTTTSTTQAATGSGTTSGEAGSDTGGAPPGSGGAGSGSGGDGGAGGGTGGAGGAVAEQPLGSDCATDAACAGHDDPGNPVRCHKSTVLGLGTGVCAPRTPVGIWEATEPPPSAQWWSPMAYVPALDALVIPSGSSAPTGGSYTSGSLVAFPGAGAGAPAVASWTRYTGIGPPAQITGALAYADGTAFLVTSFASSFPSGCAEWSSDLAASWTECAGATPGPRSHAAMASDGVRVVVHGGGDAGDVQQSDTWIHDAAGWTDAGATGPGLWRHGMVYDTVREAFFLFGGSGVGDIYKSDLWRLDGAAWTKIAVPGTAPARRGEAVVTFDEVRGRIVVYGGLDETDGSLGGGAIPRFDTWEWDGVEWIEVPTAESPSPTAGAVDAAFRGGAAYHPGVARTVAVWGTETWEYYTIGSPCRTNAHCGSGHCVEGICCATACAASVACGATGECE